ncbi:PVC-type heme-binding CxxCH protein [Calycomorphotria hydatis]|nr:PVC-type heme-binding CxxCH protein [Calycomorphotria hydatis]
MKFYLSLHNLSCLSVWAVLFQLMVTSACADEFPEVYNHPSEDHLKPMSAEEAAVTMKLPEGFRVSVFAEEPAVQNPIAMNWDEQGRLWIAENYTYASHKQRFDLSLRDRVLIFEDTNNDGISDTRSVFTDQVQMLTSVEVGKGGVWLMCPPNLLFIPDADGDGRPDGPPEVVVDGFEVKGANYHNFANGLKWGPDGWLYGRCGHAQNGHLGLPGTPPEERVLIDGGIWRYHPEKKIVEVLCHGTTNPWGHDWDRNGEIFFINTVIGHLWHAIPGAHFIEPSGNSENPLAYRRLDMIADHYHFDTSGSWTASRGGKANDLGGGHAHSGMMMYLADRWPEKYRDKLFTLNMHGRRANVERLEQVGAGYVGRHEPDFVIVEDPFFRGVDLNVGPDGNVYMIDWSDTGECHEASGVHRKSGRIYKISYGDEETATESQFAKPWCLSGDGELPRLWRDYQNGNTTPESLRELLNHKNEHVCVWAIRLLTDFWPLDTITGPRVNAVYPDDPETYNALLQLAQEDHSGLVQLTLASTLQRLPVEKRPALAKAILSHEEYAKDRDLPLLVWFGLMPVASEKPMELVSLVTDCRFPEVVRSIAHMAATQSEKNSNPLDALLANLDSLDPHMQSEVLFGIRDAFQGWRTAPKPARWDAVISSTAAEQNQEVVRDLSILFGDGRALDEIRKIALDDKQELKLRMQALETLIEARPDDLRSVCESLVSTRELNGIAVKGLAFYSDAAIAKLLIGNYGWFRQNDRATVIEVLISRALFAHELLDAIAEGRGRITTADISAFHARQIKGLNDESLSEKLLNVWGELRDSSADRKARMHALKEQLSLQSDEPINLVDGRILYNKSCSQCHKLFGEGKKVGPDLTGSQRANLDYLLENVVDPSAVVGKDYRMSIVLTADGRIFNGLVVAQDDKSLTLQTQTDRMTISMDDVDDLRTTPLSPMPDGLLDKLSEAQIRNLFAYLGSPTQIPLPAAEED